MFLAVLGCERQVDLVALRHAAQSCDASGTCPSVATDSKEDAGKPAEGSCDGPDCSMREPPPSEPNPPCGGAPACAPPKDEPVERCETRSCAVADGADSFCSSDGTVLALGDSCESDDSNPQFRYALCSQTDLIVKAPLQVNGDVAVDRDVSLTADVMVEGELRYVRSYYANGANITETQGRLQSQQQVCTLPDALSVDVAALVAARASDNDNDRAVDQLALLNRWSGQQSVTLPCGRYHLNEMDGDGSMTVNVTGNVALFVDGGISAKQGLTIRAAPSARVSLVVNGSVHVIGGFSLGELSDARHLLLAAAQINLEQGKNTIGGVLYQQSQELLLVNATLDVNGAVFAYRAQLEGATSVTLAQATAVAAESCEP
jgi:hypothetical protein